MFNKGLSSPKNENCPMIYSHSSHPTLLEEMVLFRTRNGSIPRYIYGTPKLFYIEPFVLVKGSIGQEWNPRVLYTLFLRVYRTF